MDRITTVEARGRRPVINDDVLIGWIRACIEANRYHITDHALTKHPVDEGFTLRDALEAIKRGQIIQRRHDDCRCTVCGDAPGIHLSPRFIANYIHCVIDWNEDEQIVVITMYRPSSQEWINQHTRRRP